MQFYDFSGFSVLIVRKFTLVSYNLTEFAIGGSVFSIDCQNSVLF